MKVDLEKDENNYAFTVIRVQRIADVSFANKESYNEYTMLFIFMKHYFFYTMLWVITETFYTK